MSVLVPATIVRTRLFESASPRRGAECLPVRSTWAGTVLSSKRSRNAFINLTLSGDFTPNYDRVNRALYDSRLLLPCPSLEGPDDAGPAGALDVAEALAIEAVESSEDGMG